MAGVGHNSEGVENGDASAELISGVARIRALEDERADLADDVKAELASLKAKGYDTKIVRKVLAIMKLKEGEYEEQQNLIEVYLRALDLI